MLTRWTILLLSACLLLATPAAESVAPRPVIVRRQTQQTEHADAPLPRATVAPRNNCAPTTTITAHRPYRPAPTNRPPPAQA